jgi:uracil-DNA glycosylase
MQELLKEIAACNICQAFLALGPRPILAATENSRIAIVGQAPGKVVHESGVPWQDKSGDRLRLWLGVSENQFYNPDQFALLPMGFCYPGKGKSGDLPPRTECAPQWHNLLFSKMKNLQQIILIGSYAQNYYLKDRQKKTLTETVKSYQEYLPEYFVLPHPSPRNNIWLRKNQWFEKEVIPELKRRINSTY